MLRKWILAGLLATGLTATGMYGAQAAVMDATAPQRTVSVEGQAQRELVPNKAQMRLDSVVSAGANTVSDVQFVVDQPQQLKDELLAEAIDNGRRTAQVIARAGHTRLGRLMNASVAPTNGYWPAPMMARVASDNTSSTPLFPGSQKVSMRVSLVFELVD